MRILGIALCLTQQAVTHCCDTQSMSEDAAAVTAPQPAASAMTGKHSQVMELIPVISAVNLCTRVTAFSCCLAACHLSSLDRTKSQRT